MDCFINHGKNTPKDETIKKKLWIDTDTLCNSKKNGGFGCINIKDFFSGLKLSWIRRYALNQINDHWCDIIDTLCGIEHPNDRQKSRKRRYIAPTVIREKLWPFFLCSCIKLKSSSDPWFIFISNI